MVLIVLLTRWLIKLHLASVSESALDGLFGERLNDIVDWPYCGERIKT